MHEWMQQLKTLQERDQRMARLEAQLRAAPQEKARVAARTQEAEQAASAAKDRVRDAEKAIKSAELDIESVRAKMRDFQSKSAMIKNNDDYRAALLQAEACKNQISALEDQELAAMEALEAAKLAQADAAKRLATLKEQAAQELADLDTRTANCQTELAKMQAVRAALVEAVPAEIFARYERLRTGRCHQNPEYRAFVPIQNGTCGGCHMTVTSQARNDALKGQLSACGTCGCLLYTED